MTTLNNLRLPNAQKMVIQYLKQNLPEDIYIGLQIPKTRRKKMVIVLLAGGNHLKDVHNNVRINLMCWFGDSWEQTLDFALDVDAVMQGIDQIPYSPVSYVETALTPTPSGDGESSETPVVSASYNLNILSENI